ncbi:GerAB/ArcD/ProY family transporter [Alkalihalobacillus sp. 1P02AB]|uniref:GerAB/ArcD/ProY family transporter n=1 Tax=Alkalihalobacillus sp. 1P02AB TaxID=3132260 RepID=UPI0039A613E5
MDPKIHTEKTVTSYQLFALLMSIMLGVGVLNLPRTLTDNIRTADGWISLFLAGIIVLLIYLFIIFAFKSHDIPSIDVYMEQAFGRWVSKVLCILISGYFLLLTGWQAVAMSEMIRYFLLEKTPNYLVIILIILLCGYVVYYPLPTLVRVACLFLPIALIVLLFVLGIGTKDSVLYNIRPVASEGFLPIVKNIQYALQSFQGIEVVMILFASLQSKANPNRGGAYALAFVTVIYMVTYLVVVSVLGVIEVQTLTWPTITLTHAAETNVLFTERMDTFLITAWTLQFFTTSMIALYAAVYLLDKSLPIRRGYLLLSCTIIAAVIAVLPETTFQIQKVSTWQQYVFVFIFVILPFVCYILVSIKKKVRA